MTTRVTIEPASHTVEAVLHEKTSWEGATRTWVETTILQPGAHALDVYIHSGRVLTIREVGSSDD